MNQFFSSKRFSLLVLKHWADNRKRYTLSVLAFIGILLTWFGFTLLTGFDEPMSEDLQQTTFFLMLFVIGTFYPSQYFRDLGSKARGSNFLLVPASSFEKVLCSILFTVVLFFIVFVAGFYLADVLMVSLSNSVNTSSPAKVINIFTTSLFELSNNSSSSVLFVFFSIQSLFLLGSVYFPKYSFIKTVISGFVIYFILFAFVYLLYSQLMPRGGYTSGFMTSFLVRIDGQSDQLIRLPVWVEHLLLYLVTYAFAPFLWLVTWHRLKEKQV